MRFLVDECTGPIVAQWLRDQSHEVFSVYHEARGMGDIDVIQKASTENWILITNDKDFGEKVYRERHSHRGVVFMRLENERATNKIAVLQSLLEGYLDKLPDRFVVVTETRVRFART
jgi:predicted nuclease of predicted toxin-antitoxin system